MANQHVSFLVDTNVWLNMLLGREGARASRSLIIRANERDDFLAVTSSQLKDVFYIVGQKLKDGARRDGDTLTPSRSASINEISWKSLSFIQKQAMVLSEGMSEHYEASSLRPQCSDYEDALLLACAKRSKMDFIVTNDKGLLAQTVVKALTPAQYLEQYQ